MVTRNVLQGKVQFVFMNPETILRNYKYMNMLLSGPYKNHLVVLAFNEAHCINTWLEYCRTVYDYDTLYAW